MGFGGVVGVVENKAISAQPTELGVGLSWAELGNKLFCGTSGNFVDLSNFSISFPPKMRLPRNRSNLGILTFFYCHHKRNIYLRKFKKFEDSVAIEKVEKTQYEKDQDT